MPSSPPALHGAAAVSCQRAIADMARLCKVQRREGLAGDLGIMNAAQGPSPEQPCYSHHTVDVVVSQRTWSSCLGSLPAYRGGIWMDEPVLVQQHGQSRSSLTEREGGGRCRIAEVLPSADPRALGRQTITGDLHLPVVR
jgi:hypothetical protein